MAATGGQLALGPTVSSRPRTVHEDGKLVLGDPVSKYIPQLGKTVKK
jgi:hypothetical protein